MMPQLQETQIERWRLLHEEASADAQWVSQHQERDARRRQVQQEIRDLLTRYLDGQVDTEQLRATFDRKTRKEWDVFGFKGMSGAMLLNQLVKHIPDKLTLAKHLRAVLRVPRDEAEARERIRTLWQFVYASITAHQVAKQQLQIARLPFFVSAWWHLQEPERWPIFYVSGRRALELEGVYTPTQDPVEDYFLFRTCFRALASALGLKSWELEHLLVWYEKRNVREPVSSPVGTSDAPSVPASEPSDRTNRGELLAAGSDHTQVQWFLAKIGKKLGCSVWIAVNDQGKQWNGEQLGALCMKALPNLGVDPATQRIISLIDVLWLKGPHQVAAAFEIEHTTSIYSGLLRLSDLVAMAPNLNFPLYIVAPKDRLDQVRRELSRPTFQTLELHKRCGFFAEEALLQKAPHIMEWASSPAAIENLAAKVGDVGGEEGSW
jgi:hypothetical protein